MRKVCRAVALTFTAALVPVVARAQMVASPIHFGGQLDFETANSKPGIGARAEYGLSKLIPSVPQLKLIGSFDYFFESSPVKLWELNIDAAYNIPMTASPVHPYVGAGFNYAHVSVSSGGFSASGSSSGLNLLGGVQFKAMGTLTPYAEARFETRSGSPFVLTAGVLFH